VCFWKVYLEKMATYILFHVKECIKRVKGMWRVNGEDMTVYCMKRADERVEREEQ
jgi:hypothetical protein